jgi:hypothetical protein
MTRISFPSGIPMQLSAHQCSNSSQLAGAEICGVTMKTNAKAARLKGDHGKSPFSTVACLIMLLFAGILVKFAAMTPIFHVVHWN